MARLVVATVAAVIAGVVTENPMTAVQVFGLVPGYGPPQTKPLAPAIECEERSAPTEAERDDS